MSNQLLNDTKEKLSLMNGCEVHSITYEGCVGIEGNKVYRSGEVIDTLNTSDKVNNLWDEYVRGEGF